MNHVEFGSEIHPLFPSGDWEGFYVYSWSKTRHMMAFCLDFNNKIVKGSGSDDIAFFRWQGIYDTEALICTMTKYYATHIVLYKGYVDENGIWGTWFIPPISGGFHL